MLTPTDLRAIEGIDWTHARPGDILAVAGHYEDLRLALARRKAALGLSFDELDARTGLTHGHTSKLLGPSHVKSLGPLSLGLILEALSVGVALFATATPRPLIPGRRQ